MPRGDGTGPPWGGGAGVGRGMRGGSKDSGRAIGMRLGAGPGGNCICSGCGTIVPHQAGSPCYNSTCPDCGAKLVRG